MKKCPFCAEEIQAEAIKCRWCGSFVSAAPPAASAAPVAAPAQAQPSAAAGAGLRPAVEGSGADRGERRLLYSGSPSWRAYLKHYSLAGGGAVVVAIAAYLIAGQVGASTLGLSLSILVPLVVGALAVAFITLYRKSRIFRVTTTNIETERGLLSKKIDVLELWRCRDIAYKQSLLDRILRIAHIDIFTTDVTSPKVCILGLPASRQLFEQIRDSIEIQRQARNVLGMVQ